MPSPRRTSAGGARHYPRWLERERRLREQLAALINAPAAEDVALVKNTSEGLSLVAYGLDWQPGQTVIINRQEFPSNRIVWESLAERYGVEVRDVDLAAADDPEAVLIAAMDDSTRLLTVSSVQFGSGLRMDLARLSAACHERGVLFCVDAIQSLGVLRFDVQALEADFVIADGHKWMLGPEGLGLFYVRPQLREELRILQYGWHMVANAGDYATTSWRPAPDARRFEAGSPNMVGIHGLSASLEVLHEAGLAEVERRVLEHSDHLVGRIQDEPRLELLSPAQRERRAGIVSFRRHDREPEQLYRALMGRNVACAHRAGGVRFSPHFYNTRQQLDRALDLALSL